MLGFATVSLRVCCPRRRRGVSLLEMAIATALLVSVTGILYTVMTSLPKETQFFAVEAEQNRMASGAMSMISQELRFTSPDQLSLSGQGSETLTLRFRKAIVEMDSGTVSFSGLYTLGFAHAADDPNNGVDDNGNGVTDEGMIYMIDPSGVQRVLASYVLERSLQVDETGTEREIILRFQLGRRFQRDAGDFIQIADSTGVYATQSGFAVTTRSEKIGLRN